MYYWKLTPWSRMQFMGLETSEPVKLTYNTYIPVPECPYYLPSSLVSFLLDTKPHLTRALLLARKYENLCILSKSLVCRSETKFMSSTTLIGVNLRWKTGSERKNGEEIYLLKTQSKSFPDIKLMRQYSVNYCKCISATSKCSRKCSEKLYHLQQRNGVQYIFWSIKVKDKESSDASRGMQADICWLCVCM